MATVVASFESVSIPGLVREVDSLGRWWVRARAQGISSGPHDERPTDVQVLQMIQDEADSYR